MSVSYHYMRDGTTGRPVRFRDLVRMAHYGDLGADDLVRADYEDPHDVTYDFYARVAP